MSTTFGIKVNSELTGYPEKHGRKILVIGWKKKTSMIMVFIK